jgi:hypothetical protein
MKKYILNISIFLAGFIFVPGILFGGNEQRAGQAGASELLLNPWARSSGIADANSANVHGFEAIFSNVAGTAFTRKTDLVFTRSNWFAGSGINFNAFGFAQKVGETGAISLAIVSMDFGKVDITTVELPEGGLGVYHPQYTTISLSYAKAFSNSIYGGLALKIINEGISDLTGSGVALDAGIQYVTGIGKDKGGNKKYDNLKFGIALKNVGPTMSFSGDGLSFRGTTENGTGMTVEQRSADFELPSLLKIGFAYDIPTVVSMDSTGKKVTASQTLTLCANFTSNAFTRDQFHGGIEYNIKNLIIIRGGYVYEKGIDKVDTRIVAFKGPSCGASIQIPLNKEKESVFSLDYSYRFTENFAGCHSIGARVSL